MTRLLLATRNRGKVAELRRLLSDLPGLTGLLTPDDVDGLPEVIEDGSTFEHNACKKARELAAASGLACLSDDSGLQVDALGGRPGVYSARFAGPNARDADNNQKLLEALREVPDAERCARFVAVLAYAEPSGALFAEPHTERGICEGRILRLPRGDHGFGYDPLFQPQGLDCSMAELPAAEKNRISHRAQASARMRAYLERHLVAQG